MPLVVPLTTERQRQTSYGAINLLTKTVPLQERPGGDGVNTVAYRQWWQTPYPDKKVLLLWDGASDHRGQEMQTFLAQEKAGLAEADWEITCVPFAPYAPEQNPLADLWLKGKT
jgi:hypothetical protein